MQRSGELVEKIPIDVTQYAQSQGSGLCSLGFRDIVKNLAISRLASNKWPCERILGAHADLHVNCHDRPIRLVIPMPLSERRPKRF